MAEYELSDIEYLCKKRTKLAIIKSEKEKKRK